jgi:hypothetical protein
MGSTGEGTPPGAPEGTAGRARGARAPQEYGPPESYRVRALLALGVAAIGVGAFVVGLREAVRRIPPDAEARAAVRGDSARRAKEADAARLRAARGGGGGRTQPAELPRLR